jgi:serine/threonine-protein kinase RsbW
LPRADGDIAKIGLPAGNASLEQFREFVLAEAQACGLPQAMSPKLDLVLEEALVNVINYAYPDGQGMVDVACYLAGDGGQQQICVRIEDSGPAFDPFAREDPDVKAAVEERSVGGLGIYFIKEMADEVCYVREGDKNVLTFCFAVGA